MAEISLVLKVSVIVLLIGVTHVRSQKPAKKISTNSTSKPSPSTTTTTTSTPSPTTLKLCTTTEQGNIIGRKKRDAQTPDYDDCITTTEVDITSDSATQELDGSSTTEPSPTANTQQTPSLAASATNLSASSIPTTQSPQNNNLNTTGTVDSSTLPLSETTDSENSTQGEISANAMTTTLSSPTTDLGETTDNDTLAQRETTVPDVPTVTQGTKGIRKTTPVPPTSTTNKSGSNSPSSSKNYDHELVIIFGVMLGLMLLAIFIFCVYKCYKRDKQETMMTGGGDISIKMSQF